MAKNNSSQQSSQLKKLLVVGAGLVVIVLVAFPSGASTPSGPKKPNPLAGLPQTKKSAKESLYTDEDKTKKFEAVGGSIKNGFVPLVTKNDGALVAKNEIPRGFSDGQGGWTYTGNMVVDGTPNALLENTASGDGVFLRPGQRWKSMRLLAVKEDSIELEGPRGERKTVFFDDKNILTSAPSTNLQTLPPATIQGTFPGGTNPQPGGNPRRQRGQQANQANMDSMVGPIGSSNNFDSSLGGQDFTNNSNNNGNNRRIRTNQ